MITLLGIPNCDQVRKARRWLDSREVGYHFHDLRSAGLPSAFAAWLARFGWHTLLNSKSTTWRNLPPERRTDLDNDKALILASEQPSLIKRPLLTTHLTADAPLLIGFDAEHWANFLDEHDKR